MQYSKMKGAPNTVIIKIDATKELESVLHKRKLYSTIYQYATIPT